MIAQRRWFPPLLLVLISVALFASSWTDAVQVADSGELVTAACRGGVAHPPGYPLYVLLGRALCALPWSTPAGRVGLLSLVAAVCALLALYGCVVRLTGNAWAAAVAALTLGTGSIFWRQSSLAEVFGLNAALSLTVVYASLRLSAAAPRPALLWALLSGLTTGLALSNHHSSVIVAPLVALAVVWPPRPAARVALRAALALLGALVGLLPYLQLLLADPQRIPRWGDTSSWSGLVHHVLRRDYGTFSLTLGGQAAPLQNVGHYLARVPSQLGWVLWLPALVGIIALLRRAARRPLGRALEDRTRRDVALLLALLPLLAGPAFMLLFNLQPEGISAQVIERFHVLPNALLALCLGVGLAVLDDLWLSGAGREVRGRIWRVTAWTVVGASALLSFGRADVSASYAAEDYVRDALGAAERGALILGQGDERVFGMLYVQQMLGVRPDVQYVDFRMLGYRWYVAQKQRERPGFSYRFEPRRVAVLRLISDEQRRGVPVYLATVPSQKVVAAYPGYPAGPLLRLLPPGQMPPSALDVEALNQRLFRGFVRRGRPPDPEVDPWSASLREPYAVTWRTISRALYDGGDRRGALRAMSLGQDWAPWLPVPEWFGQPGRLRAIPRLPR
jgi:hypothetical protein